MPRIIIFLLVLLLTRSMANTPCPTGMIFVKGGSFMMGCTKERDEDCQGNEEQEYKMTVSDFCIGQAPVTLKEWLDVMGDGYKLGYGISDNHPVTNISWEDTQEYLRLLNKRTDKQYRLPTEVEWEYAARGGSKSRGYKYSGSDSIDKVAWYESNGEKKTHEVCRKVRNELGLCDMSGNVYEWMNDLYVSKYISRIDCLLGWRGKWDTTGVCHTWRHILRGGSWKRKAIFCRVFSRGADWPNNRDSEIGFRIALTPMYKKETGR